MGIESTCSTSVQGSSTVMESVKTSDVQAKLRRLKIQESVITASLEKCNFNQDDHTTLESNHISDWKIRSVKLNNNITEIKNMFEDIKIATSDSTDNLKNINIEEIKTDILNLNDKIKSMEDFINTELTSMISEEKEIIRQINKESKGELMNKGKIKIHKNQYNEVVPSPVRVLINSPLKCTEVQQFQEFMSKSKNRYGGWNEYNHNIFVQIWNKFYATDDIVILKNNVKEINCNKLLPQFKDEVYEKIPGIQLDDIILHSKWFSEFCYLKKAQQAALDKWRDNKSKIKGRHGKVKNNKSIIQNSNSGKLCRKQNEIYNQKTKFKDLPEDDQFKRNQNLFDAYNKEIEGSLQMNEDLIKIDPSKISSTEFIRTQIIRNSKSSTLLAPTEQWTNRCNGKSEHQTPRRYNNIIENVDKLCIPNWRLSLHKPCGIKEI